MARFRQIKNVFSSGELSPKLHKLAGLDEFQKGLAEQLNQISIGTGGSFSRPGSKFIYAEEPIDITDPQPENVLMIPINNDSGFNLILAIEFASGSSKTGTISKLIDLDFGPVNDVVSNLLDPEYMVVSYENYYETGVTGEEYPWNTTESALDCSYIQIENAIIVVHNSGKFQPMVWQLLYPKGVNTYPKITMHSWLFYSTASDDVKYFVRDLAAPFRMPNYRINADTANSSFTYMTPSVQYTGGATMTVRIVDGNGTFSFNTDLALSWVGKTIFIEWVDSATPNRVFGIITATTGATFDLLVTGSNASPTDTIETSEWTNVWWISSWGGADLYPRCVGFYEERLLMASTINQPSTIWVSNLGDYAHFMSQRSFLNGGSNSSLIPDFSGDALTSDPFNIIPADGGIVTWLNAQDKVYFGTYSGEFIGGGVQFQFSNTQAFVKNQDNKGGIRVQTYRTNDGVVFIGRNGKTLLQFKSSDNGAHITRNLSLLADHIVYSNADDCLYTGVKFRQLTWQNNWSVLWAVTTENQLVGITIDPDTNTLGWHRHELGGNAEVLSICAVRGSNEDSLVLYVRRTVNDLRPAADTFRYVYSYEKLSDFKESPNMNCVVNQQVYPYPEKLPLPLSDSNGGQADPQQTNIGSKLPYTYKETSENDLPWFMDSAVYLWSQTPKTTWKILKRNLYTETITAWDNAATYTYGDIVVENPNVDGSAWIYTSDIDFVGDGAGTFADEVQGLASDWVSLDIYGFDLPVYTFSKNEMVHVVADGNYIGTKQTVRVSNLGYKEYLTITLDSPATSVVIGKSFTKRIKTLPINTGSQIGDSLEPIKRIDRVQISVYNSKGGKYGSEDNDLKSLEYTGDTTTLETTDFIEAFPSSNDRLAQVILEEDRPLPMNILSISMRGVTHDG